MGCGLTHYLQKKIFLILIGTALRSISEYVKSLSKENALLPEWCKYF